MGSGAWKSTDWSSYRANKNISNNSSASSIYSNIVVLPQFLPKNVVRESCDSKEHPNSTPIIIGLDTTGSMNDVLESIAKHLGDLMKEILNRQPVSDPQIMCCAIDDYFAHSTPLQVTQFESDIRIAEQLMSLHFTRHGGGNGFESYPLAWYFASRHTKIDCYERHDKKGILITMGDDGFPETMSAKELSDVFDDVTTDVDVYDLVNEVSEKYEIFHLCIEHGHKYNEQEYQKWRELLGSHAVIVSDIEKLSEIIIGILEKLAGKAVKDIVKDWDGSTAMVVTNAIEDIQVFHDAKQGFVQF